MVNLRKLNECIFNCRQAGDSLRNNQPFKKSAIMICAKKMEESVLCHI